MALALKSLIKTFFFQGIGAYAEAKSTIDITGNTTLTSLAGDVRVKSEAISYNRPTSISYSDAKFSMGVTVAVIDTTATTNIESGVDITAIAGNVDILSKGEVEGRARTNITVLPTSSGAVTLTVLISAANVKTTVNGTIAAGGSARLLEVDVANLTAGSDLPIDTSVNEHGLEAGESVVYENTAGEPIGELSDGFTYWAVVDDANPTRVQLAASDADAYNGDIIDLSLTDTFGDSHSLTLEKDQLDFDAVNIGSDQIVFDTAHGLSTGDEVIYTSMANDDIGGLLDGFAYYVIAVDSVTISLAATSGRAADGKSVALSATAESEMHALVARPGSSSFYLFDPIGTSVVDETNNIIDLGVNHGWSTGDQLLYRTGSIGGLIDGETLQVASVTPTAVKLRRAEPIDLDASNTSATSTHTLTPTEWVEVDPVSDVDADTDVVTILGHGFSDGQSVIFMEFGGDGTDIENGAENGSTYYVSVESADTFKLATDDTLATTVDFESNAADVYILAFDADLGDARYANFSFVPTDSVDSDSDTITIAGHNLATGDILTYNTDPGADVVDADTGHIYLAPNDNLEYLFHASAAMSVDYDNDAIYIGPHNLQTRDALIYSSESDDDGDVGGLTDGMTYNAIVLDSETIQLATSGVAVDLIDNDLVGIHSLQSTRKTVDLDSDTIFKEGHGLSEDEEVRYLLKDNTGTEIGGLTSGRTYYVRVVDDHHFQLSENAGGHPVDLTAGATGTAHDIQFGWTITRTDTPIKGLLDSQVYFAVVIDQDTISLAETLDEALNAEPITLDPNGAAASGHELTPVVGAGAGIKIQSLLEADISAVNTAKASRAYNRFLTKYAPGPSVGDGFFGKLMDFSSKASLQANNPAKVQAGASASVLVTDHEVATTIGSNAVLKSGADIRVDGEIVQTNKMIAVAQTCDLNGLPGMGGQGQGQAGSNRSLAVTLAFGVGVYDNDVSTVIETGAQIDAAGRIDIESDLTLERARIKEDDFKNMGKAPHLVYDILAGDVLFHFFNGVAFTSNKNVQSGVENAIAGTVIVTAYTNRSEVLVEDGVLINQNAAYQNSLQDVNILAESDITQVQLSGIMTFNLSASSLIGALAMMKNTVLSPYGNVAKNVGVGGSVVVQVYDNTTKATIGEGVQIRTGSAGGLSVQALEEMMTINVAFSGGSAGKVGVTFSGTVLTQNSTTRASIDSGAIIDSGAPVNAKGEGEDSILVKAESDMLHVGFSGAWQKGTKASIGYSFGVNSITRDTEAFIGRDEDADDQAPAAIPTNIFAAGDIRIEAENKGHVVQVAVAGSIKGEEESDGNNEAFQFRNENINEVFRNGNLNLVDLGNVKTGIGFAGDAEVNIINDSTRAYVNDDGAVIQTNGDMTVFAANSTSFFNFGGSVAIAKGQAKNPDSQAAKQKVLNLAGSFAWNQVTMTTKAFIDGADLTIGGDVTVEAKRPSESFFVALSAGLAGSVNESADTVGYMVAGSISINLVDVTTTASIDSATLNVMGSVTVEAIDRSEIVAIGGAIAAGSAMGFGLSVGVNDITSTTTATVVDSVVVAGGGLTIEADTDAYIVGFSVAVGHGNTTDDDDVEIGFGGMVSVNAIDTGTEAKLLGSDVVTANTGAHVTVQAVNASTIVGIGGAVAIGDDAGLGAGVIYSEIDADVLAVIDSSDNNASTTIDAAGNVDVLAQKHCITLLFAASAATAENSLTGSFAISKAFGVIDAHIADSVILATGDVTVEAQDLSASIVFAGASVFSQSNKRSLGGVGVAMGLNLFASRITAAIENSTVTAGGNVDVLAAGNTIMVGIAAGFSAAGNATLSAFGSLVLNWDLQYVDAHIIDSIITAPGGEVTVRAVTADTLVSIAGALAYNGQGNAAFGASIAYNYVGGSLADVDDDVKNGLYLLLGEDSMNEFESLSWADTQAYIENSTVYAAHVYVLAGFEAPPDLSMTSVEAGGQTFLLPDEMTSENITGIYSFTISGAKADTFALGAAISLNFIDRDVSARIAANSTIEATGDVQVSASQSPYIFSLAIGGGRANAGGGAAAAVNEIQGLVEAYVEGSSIAGSAIDGLDSLTVSAAAGSEIVSVAIAGAQADDFLGAAAAFSLNWIRVDVDAHIANAGVVADGAGGDVNVLASDQSEIYGGLLSVAFSKSAAFGLSLTYNYIGGDPDDPASTDLNDITAYIDNSTVDAGGEVNVLASSQNTIVNVSAGGADSVDSLSGLSGSISVNFIRNTLAAGITGSTVTAAGNINVLAGNTSQINAISGNFGSAAATNDIQSDIDAIISAGSITSTAGSVSVVAEFAEPGDLSGSPFGLSDQINAIAIGFVTAEQALTIAGSLALNWIRNDVDAHITGSAVTAALGDVSVMAVDTATINSAAGALSINDKTGSAAGASFSYNYLGSDPNDPASSNTNEIQAYIEDSAVTAEQVVVQASSKGGINTLAVMGAHSGKFSIAGAISLNFSRKEILAGIRGASSVTATGNAGDFGIDVNASNETLIWSLAGQITAGGSDLNLGLAFAYNEIYDTTQAAIDGTLNPNQSDLAVSTADHSIRVMAKSDTEVFTISAGVGGANSKLNASGSVAIAILGNTTLAFIEHAEVSSDRNLYVLAENDGAIGSYGGVINVTTAPMKLPEADAGGADEDADSDFDSESVSSADWSDIGVGSLISIDDAGSDDNESLYGSGSSDNESLYGPGDAENYTQGNEAAYIDDAGADDLPAIPAVGAQKANSVGIGGGITVNLVDNTTKAYIKDAVIEAFGNDAVTITVKDWERDGEEIEQSMRGLAVIASSTETLQTINAAVTASEGIALSVDFVFSRVTDTTWAYIENSDVNTAANKGHDVRVRAHHDVDLLTGVGAGSFSKDSGSAGGTIDVTGLYNDTQAYITATGSGSHSTIYAGGDVEVLSLSRTDLLAASVGIMIAKSFSAGGTLEFMHLSSNNRAYIKEVNIYADGNVEVTALTRIPGITIGTGAAMVVDGGAEGKGIAAGASVGALIVENTTEAFIEGAHVNAKGDVLVEAFSKTDIMSVVTTAAASISRDGWAANGSFSVIFLNSATSASIRAGTRAAVINGDAGYAGGDVTVLAVDKVRIETGLGAASIAGQAAIGGAFDIIVIQNSVEAYIGAGSQVFAAGDVVVRADSYRRLTSYTLGVAGSFGTSLNGTLSFISIGTGSASKGTAEITDTTDGVNGWLGDMYKGSEALPDGSTADSAKTAINSQSAPTLDDALSGTDLTVHDVAAYVGAGAIIGAGGDLTVQASETVIADVWVGRAAFGIVAAGASGGIFLLETVVEAFVDDSALLWVNGALNVWSWSNERVALLVTGGSFSTTFSLAAQYSGIHNNSKQLAYIDDNVVVLGATGVLVLADHERDLLTATGGASFGGKAGVGLSWSETLAGGEAKAWIGDNVQLEPAGEAAVQAFTIFESASPGSGVGTVTLTTTAGSGVTRTFAITGGNDGQAFAIDTDTGHLTVASTAVLDYESRPIYALSVDVLDNGAVVETLTVRIGLTDTAQNDTLYWTLLDNAINGTAVGVVPATGEDSLFYITAGNDDGVFALDEYSGRISVEDYYTLDASVTGSYVLTVEERDSETSILLSTFTITVNMVTAGSTAPVFSDPGYYYTVSEVASLDEGVGVVRATDADPGDEVTYSIISGNDNGAFGIDARSGLIMVADPAALDYETATQQVITIQATDLVGLTDMVDVTVSLTDNPLNSVYVIANSNTKADSITIALGGGIALGGNASIGNAIIDTTIEARVGDSAKFTVDGDVVIKANASHEADVMSIGVSLALGLSIGASIGEASVAPEMKASLGSDALLRAGTIEVGAALSPRGGEEYTAHIFGVGSTGSILIGLAGTFLEANSEATVRAELGDNADLQADDAITIVTDVSTEQEARAGRFGTSLIAAVGTNEVTVLSSNTVESTIGPGANIHAGTLEVTAKGNDVMEAEANTGSAALVNVNMGGSFLELDFWAAVSTIESTSHTEASIADSTSATPTVVNVDQLVLEAEHTNYITGVATNFAAPIIGVGGPLLKETVSATTLVHVGNYAQIEAGRVSATARSGTEVPELMVGSTTYGGLSFARAENQGSYMHDTGAVIGDHAHITVSGDAADDFIFSANNNVDIYEKMEQDFGGLGAELTTKSTQDLAGVDARVEVGQGT